MNRLFNTHKIRKTNEAGGLWELTAGSYRGRIAVPCCWETIPALAAYKGKGTYRNKYTFGGLTRFVFKGVSHTAKVYCDGQFIVCHYNAYTPFHADIYAEYGEHEIMVEVDNSYSPESALHIDNDYYTYGGIIRPLIIEELPAVFIERLAFTPAREGTGWSGQIDLTITNTQAEAITAKVDLAFDEQTFMTRELVLDADCTRTFSFSSAFTQVSPYSPESPALYSLGAVLHIGGKPADDLIERVGFREIKIKGRQILLNGEPLMLRGFNRHEDYNSLGASIPLQAMMRDIALMKEAGANAVRTSHYPNDELFLDLCDELGIMVWEEAHARALSEEQMKHPAFERQSMQCIDEMIRYHHNHPSIFCWGILNECVSDTPFGRSCYQKQFDRIAALDASRPKTFASFRKGRDICLDLVDIVSFNIYPKWYEDIPTAEMLEYLKSWIDSTGNGSKPLIISEIGAGAVYGCRSEAQAKWSEERQAEILRDQLTAVTDDPDICGVFVWQFCDCRVDEGWFASRPKTQNNKGIVDEFRRKKLAFQTVKEIFSR